MKPFYLLLFCLLLFNCSVTRQVEVHLASRENNVCKLLIGNVVLYAIFVDSKYTKPWSEYDIRSTLDSIQKGMDWVIKKAKENNHFLSIEVSYHTSKNGSVPIYQDFSKKTLSATLFKLPVYSGIKDIYKWADRISAEAAKSLPKDTSVMVKTANNLQDRERLLARLRDIYKTDNIALMYFINNYYTNEVSVTLDTNNGAGVEFSVVSFKKPAVIAHEFLHLFGAWDLYITPFDNKKDKVERKKQAMELFPNEIMAFAYRNLDSLDVSQFTKYAIGWDKGLEPKYAKLLLGKKIKPARY